MVDFVDLCELVDLVDLFELVDLVDLIQSVGSIALVDLVDLAYIIPPDLPNLTLSVLPNAASGFSLASIREEWGISF